jgi:hypothetical protein
VRLFNYGTMTAPGFGGSQEFIKRIFTPSVFANSSSSGEGDSASAQIFTALGPGR